MKIIVVTWRQPDGSPATAQFEAEKFLVRDTGNLIKIHDRENNTDVVWVPVSKLESVQFGETKEEPRIVVPSLGPKAVPATGGHS